MAILLTAGGRAGEDKQAQRGIRRPKPGLGVAYWPSTASHMTLCEALPVESARAPQPSEVEGTWAVAQVYSRHEKALAEVLDMAGIHHFLPVERRRKLVAGRRREFFVPVFPGYLFVCCRYTEDFYGVRQRRQCYGMISVANQSRFIRELDNLFVAEQDYRLHAYKDLVVGTRCRVREGAMKDAEGVLVRRDKKDLFVMQVEILGQSCAMEIDADLLEPCD